MTIGVRAALTALIAATALYGCGSDQTSGGGTGTSEAAGEPGMQGSAAAAPEAEDINTLVANADIARGQTLYLQCRACHTLNAGGANKVGPNLHGMFDRKAGLAPGFAYSDALKNSDLTWDLASLDPWLARPSAFLPGNRMVFVGVKKPQDRANLIAFLQRETATAE